MCLGCYFFNFIVLDGLERGIVDIGSCIVDIGILIYCIDVVRRILVIISLLALEKVLSLNGHLYLRASYHVKSLFRQPPLF